MYYIYIGNKSQLEYSHKNIQKFAGFNVKITKCEQVINITIDCMYNL